MNVQNVLTLGGLAAACALGGSAQNVSMLSDLDPNSSFPRQSQSNNDSGSEVDQPTKKRKSDGKEISPFCGGNTNPDGSAKKKKTLDTPEKKAERDAELRAEKAEKKADLKAAFLEHREAMEKKKAWTGTRKFEDWLLEVGWEALQKMADSSEIQSSMLQDGTFINFVNEQNICCTATLKNGQQCGNKMRVTSTVHRQTCGIFTLTCDSTAHEPENKRHSCKYKTQFPCDGDYSLNRLLTTAEVVSSGSLGQLEQRHALLKMAPVCPNYYDTQMDRLAAVLHEVGDEKVDAAWGSFKRRPFTERVVELDARHATARNSKQTSFEVLEKTNHQIIFLRNIDTDEETGNSCRNEAYALKMFLEKCVAEGVELCMVVHDSCSEASGFIQRYNEQMAESAAAAGLDFKECIDANDLWHGQKSYQRSWEKLVEIKCKPRIKATQAGIPADSQVIQKRKEQGQRQLNHPQIKKRLLQALIQVCEAACGNKPLATKTLRTMLRKCLIEDDHSTCIQVAGQDCYCAIEKRMRDRADRLVDPAALAARQDIIESAKDPTENCYLAQERFEAAAVSHGIELSAASAISSCGTHTGLVGNETEGENEGHVMAGGVRYDPYQPVDTQLTHPLAMSVLTEFIQSRSLASLVESHCYCQNTSFVESFHNVILIYVPKRKHYQKHYSARVKLAAMDWQENSQRVHKVNLDTGTKMLPPKTYKFQQEIADKLHGKVMWSVDQ